jgi:hypothetical protein
MILNERMCWKFVKKSQGMLLAGLKRKARQQMALLTLIV